MSIIAGVNPWPLALSDSPGLEIGEGDFHVMETGMLIVSLRGVNC